MRSPVRYREVETEEREEEEETVGHSSHHEWEEEEEKEMGARPALFSPVGSRLGRKSISRMYVSIRRLKLCLMISI